MFQTRRIFALQVMMQFFSRYRWFAFAMRADDDKQDFFLFKTLEFIVGHVFDHDIETFRSGFVFQRVGQSFAVTGLRAVDDRSEERRVGKECRSRWSPYH